MVLTRSMRRRGLTDGTPPASPQPSRPRRTGRRRRRREEDSAEERPPQARRLDDRTAEQGPQQEEQGQRSPPASPPASFPSVQEILDEAEPHFQCHICLDWTVAAHQLECRHRFCGPCLKGQLDFGHRACGVCRSAVTVDPEPHGEMDELVETLLGLDPVELARWRTRFHAWNEQRSEADFSWGVVLPPQEGDGAENVQPGAPEADSNDGDGEYEQQPAAPRRRALGLFNPRV